MANAKNHKVGRYGFQGWTSNWGPSTYIRPASAAATSPTIHTPPRRAAKTSAVASAPRSSATVETSIANAVLPKSRYAGHSR